MADQGDLGNRQAGFIDGPGTTRPLITGTDGVIATGHPLTSAAGMRMLLSGGNAVDAVVASLFAAAVVEPTAAFSLAAESVFMVYDSGSGDLRSLSGQGVAPARATVDFYRTAGLDSIPTGPGEGAPMSFTVPGAVHAAISLLRRYGTKSLNEVIAPALRYATEGIPPYRHMITFLEQDATISQFELFPHGGLEVFYSGGKALRGGSLLCQPGLANTLKALATAENSSSGGRADGLQAAADEFHRGGVARSMAESSARVGGVLEYQDVADYRSRFEMPLRVTFAGYEICGQRTWSQAGVLLQALNILTHFDLRAMGHNTPAYIHTVTEALKLSLADRQAYYGDPEYAEVPVKGLLSAEYAQARASLIDMARSAPQMPSPGDPWTNSPCSTGFSDPAVSSWPTAHPLTPQTGTTHIAAIDRGGNMAAATPSGGSFEKSVYFGELGCALSTRIEVFNLSPGHPNVIEAGKRPRTTLVNYLALRDGVPTMTFGCPGGDHQTQANLQLMLNTFLFGMDPQEAVEAPRFATDSVPDSFFPHRYFPGQLSLEAGISGDTAEALERLGHKVVRSQACGMGALITCRDPQSGLLTAGADPRRPAYAFGW